MKRIFAVLLIAMLTVLLCLTAFAAEETTAAPGEETTTAIAATQPEETTDPSEPTDPDTPEIPVEPEKPVEDVVSLDGKTVLIVGNSMVYYGNCVLLGDQGEADYGYFYQLIASNGEEATVIDHTYPGKKLEYIYENYLVKLQEEACARVDYLVLSEGNQYNDDLVGTCEKIIALFPNIEGFRFLRQPNMFDVDDEELYLPVLIEQVEKLREAGYEVVDWGKLVRDIFTGAVEVPGATLPFERTAFMKENKGYKNAAGTAVSQGNSGDRNHQNPLSGYITAQMLYTSLTNRSAVFSDYSFCGDKSISPYMDLPEFERVHYTGEKKTNFRQIFASAEDMLGLQKLIDIYVAKEGRHPLTVQKGVEATCTSRGLTQGSYCSLCGKVASTQQVIESLGEHELVFHKGKEETCTEDGLTDGITCKNCSEIIKPQEKIPARVHSGIVEITAATTSADGLVKSSCKYCGEVLINQQVSRVKSISISESSYIYDGTEHKPTVTVIDCNGNALAEGTDYTVGYESGRIQPGKYTVKVTLKGNYSGVHRRYFTVTPKAVATLEAESTSDSITISWPAADGAAYYRIYALNEKTGAFEFYASATEGTSFTATGLSSGKEYSFKVRSVVKDEDAILSAYSPECKTATKPAAVTQISAAQTDSSITLSWKGVDGANAYRVYRYNEETNSYKSVAYVKDTTSCEVKKLSAGTAYRFKIRAYMNIESGEYIGAQSAEFTAATKPAAVTQISAAQTDSSITLSWNGVKGATAYRIYRYSTKTKAFESVAYVKGATSYEVKKLSAGTVYKFKIRAYIENGTDKLTGALSKELRTATKPSVTKKITATQTTASIKLSWKSVKGATAYRVYRYDSKTKTYKSVAYVKGATSYELKSLSAGKTYKFRIRAYADIDCGKFIGAQSEVFVTSTKPDTPAVKAVSSSKGKVTLTWNDVSGETKYQIYYAQKGADAYTLYSEIKADSKKATVSSLKSGKTYSFRVRACRTNDGGTVYGGYKTVSVKVK